MATSGSTDYTLTAREVITFALRKINILPQGEDVATNASDDAADAMVELNMLCKEWQTYPSIWRLTEAILTPTASTAAISLATQNPYRVIDARYRNASSIDLPMHELTRQEYYDLPQKTTLGIPTQWYFDPQRATNTLYIWPVLSTVSTDRVHITYQRRFEDVDDLANEIDITQEHLGTIGYNLAARLADDYGRKGPHIDRVIARAQAMEQAMIDADRPEIIRFVPERRYG